MRTYTFNRNRGALAGLLFSAVMAMLPMHAFATGQPGDVDLSPTPPDLTASVDPNIVVTFDDSGSMDSNFMGDNRPFDNGSWTGPWFCAGSIDPRVTDPANIKSHAMNGTFYNPLALVSYDRPIKEDNTLFPNADATLAAVWADGIAVNRPTSPVTAAGATYLNNPIGPGTATATDTRVGNLKGVRTVTPGTASGSGAQCPANADSGSCVCTGSGSRRVCNWTVTTDNRWKCGYGTSPMDGTTANPDGGTYPNGGPYYYRLKSTVSIPVDAFGNPTAAGRTALYTVANWEAIPVPVAEYQNVANWYAYYRTRNLLTRTALSRVFGQFGDNIRAAWQNINNSSFNLPATTIITNLNDTNTAALNYRKQFYDWVFQVGASGSTPDRLATIRAGQFFTRANTSNLRDPYWEPGQGTQPGRELACRQNFNMLVTDGYWHEGNPATPSGFFGVQDSTTPASLPDGTAFNRSDTQSRVIWNVPPSPTGNCSPDPGGTNCYPSLADIAFYYWAKDLRSDLANNVPPYLPDKTTGITGSQPYSAGDNALQNEEIYYNPSNDPASWQHVVQFMVTLGIAGQLRFSTDADCVDPNNDLCKLRKGQPNSAGITGWPIPANNDPKAIDDTWHAAINSRGSYFSASNPTALVQHLTDVINNILSRRGSSTALSATMSTLTAGTQGYSAGYDTSDYSGFLIKQDLDPATGDPGASIWDASCLLSGGTFSAGVCTMPPGVPPNVSSRRTVFTTGNNGTGRVNFTWSSLSGQQQNALNQDPNSTLKCNSPTDTTNGCDGLGQFRVEWMRGDRTHEATPPLLRHRSSVLGAIINSQPRYVSAPTGGFTDNFPPGSPEALAAAPDANGLPGAGSYAEFVNANKNRAPTVYVGANDGMLHAFNGVTGVERWSYVPVTLFGIDNVGGESTTATIARRRLAKMTNTQTYKSATTVDNTAVIQDVFINTAWHTVLVGSLRYGGRGIFALDVTDPTAPTVLWEINFAQSSFAHLGYTYAYPNVSRIAYSGGKWVVLLSSGYFPLPNQTPPDPVADDPAANQTSLFVIDLATGARISEIRTTGASTTYGLSTAAAYDLNSDHVDDIAAAGDLTGNLFRFDLSNANSGNWTVDLMFKSYAAGDEGKHPISVMPVGMRDTVAQTPMWVFGTGKFLGLCDRTASSPPSGCGPDANTAMQAFYGVRDYGTASTNYPIAPAQLNSWTISQDSATGIRSLSGPTVVNPNRGWTIPLDVSRTGEHGERDVVSIVPFYSANYAILTTLIPKGDDPCDPGRRGAIMAVNGGTGGPLVASPLGGGGPMNGASNAVVGEVINSTAIPIAGIPAVVGSQGGPLLLPGLPQFAIPAPPPHRGEWRELLDLL